MEWVKSGRNRIPLKPQKWYLMLMLAFGIKAVYVVKLRPTLYSKNVDFRA